MFVYLSYKQFAFTLDERSATAMQQSDFTPFSPSFVQRKLKLLK